MSVQTGDSLVTGHIHAHNQGPVMLLEGNQNVYTEYFPMGYASGRRAYMGYPGNSGYWQSTFTLNNEFSNGDIRFQTNGTGKCVFDRIAPYVLTGNANLLTFEGVDHCYMGFYPKGTQNTRRAWMGFGSPVDNEYTFQNENTTGGHITFVPGANANVIVKGNLQVNGIITTPNVLTSSAIYTKCKDAVTSLLMRKGTKYYVGTGFFISATGTIATAGHNLLNTDILDRMDDIWCTATNVNGVVGVNRVIKCTHVGADGAGDIGVLQTTGLTSQAFLEWGDAAALTQGDTCYVIGDPMGVDVASVAKGVVRDPHYVDVNGQALLDNIFVDCIAYGGNSGSPIVNEFGKVVGIYTFGFSQTEGLGGGPSQSMAQQVVNTILSSQTDYTQKGFMGFRWQSVTHRTIVTSGLSLSFDLRGVQIIQIVTGAPMNVAGFQVGDIITEIDGQELGNLGENQRSPSVVTWFKTAGQTITVSYVHPPSMTVLQKVITLDAYPVSYDQPLLGNMNTDLKKVNALSSVSSISNAPPNVTLPKQIKVQKKRAKQTKQLGQICLLRLDARP